MDHNTPKNITKKVLAKELGISRSAIYYQPKKSISDAMLKAKIEAIMHDHPAYGHRRIAMALGRNKKVILRVMKLFHLTPRLRRRTRPHKLDDQKRIETRVKSILSILCPIRPNIVWAGDFTYVCSEGKFWYVATVIDVYTREILGWHIANHHTYALIVEAFKDAVKRTGVSPPYFHSDQGSEYVSGAYQTLLTLHHTQPSHSQKSSPWQNGYQESFYSNFKLELENTNRFQNIGELIEAIHQQMHYYNQTRIHSKLKMSPVQFKNLHIQKYLAYAAGGNHNLMELFKK